MSSCAPRSAPASMSVRLATRYRPVARETTSPVSAKVAAALACVKVFSLLASFSAATIAECAIRGQTGVTVPDRRIVCDRRQVLRLCYQEAVFATRARIRPCARCSSPSAERALIAFVQVGYRARFIRVDLAGEQQPRSRASSSRRWQCQRFAGARRSRDARSRKPLRFPRPGRADPKKQLPAGFSTRCWPQPRSPRRFRSIRSVTRRHRRVS